MNIRIATLLALLVPSHGVINATQTPTAPSPTTSPRGSFSTTHDMHTQQPYAQPRYKNAHVLTQFAIGALANGFSQNSIKSKLVANGVGITCGLAAHVFLNSSYSESLLRYLGKEPAAPSGDTYTPKCYCEKVFEYKKFFEQNLSNSCLGYGAGATTGALMRYGYDKAAQWLESHISVLRDRVIIYL